MVKEVKRMHYYNGLFLKEDDFRTEQNYNIQMRRMMNWSLNKVYGVLEGLEVKPTSGKKYKITPGIALSKIDNKGTEIVLTSDDSDDSDDYLVDFSDKGPGDYYVTISYDEVKGDKDESKGTQEIHWIEKPKISTPSEKPDSPEKEIILAKINVPTVDWQSDNNFVNTDERKEIGPVLRSINNKLEVDGTVGAKAFKGDGSEITLDNNTKIATLAQGLQDHISSSGNLKLVSLRGFTAADGADGNDAERTEVVGFEPKLILISGAYYVKLVESSYGNAVSGFWTGGNSMCSTFIVKKSSTSTEITAGVTTSPFDMQVSDSDNGIGEHLYGVINFTEGGTIKVTLKRVKQADKKSLEEFSIDLFMLCIG